MGGAQNLHFISLVILILQDCVMGREPGQTVLNPVLWFPLSCLRLLFFILCDCLISSPRWQVPKDGPQGCCFLIFLPDTALCMVILVDDKALKNVSGSYNDFFFFLAPWTKHREESWASPFLCPLPSPRRKGLPWCLFFPRSDTKCCARMSLLSSHCATCVLAWSALVQLAPLRFLPLKNVWW